MQRGRVSYSKVRALTRVATPENEAALLDVALAGTAVHVEQVTRAWRRVDRAAEIAEDGRRHAHRELRTWVDDDGMVVIRGRLAPEVGAAVLRALDAASEQLRTEAADAPEEDAPEAASEQRRADALGRVAEAALSAQLDPGTAGDRYQVVLHVDAATLAHDAATAQGADHPTYVPAGTSSVVRPTAAGRAAAIRQPGSDAAAGVGDPQGAAGDSVDSAPTGASHRPEESTFPRERAGRREALTGQVSATLLAPRTVRRCWRTPAGCASPRKRRAGWRATPDGSS